MPGMLNCAYPHHVKFNEEDIYPYPIWKNEIILSKGCKRRCSFCVNSFRVSHKEQNPDVVQKFIRDYPKKEVLLISNAINDVSYFPDIQKWLIEYNKHANSSAYSIYKINADTMNRSLVINVGIEGFSERLRMTVKKNIKRRRLHNLFEMAEKYGQHFKLCYQFNLPITA